MLSNAVTLSLLTVVSGYIIFRKLPTKLQAAVMKWPAVTDIIALLGTYLLFGGTVTALIAGALTSVLVSALLHIALFPEDFEWLFDTLDKLKGLIEKSKELLKDFNNSYREMKDTHPEG